MSLSQSAIQNPSSTTYGLHASFLIFIFFTICWVPVVCSWFCMVLMDFQLFMTAPFLCLFFLRAVVRKRVASDSRG